MTENVGFGVRSQIMLDLSIPEERQILQNFSPQEQQQIQYRKRVLSSLAYFIGKDLQIPVYAGLPSQENPSGWHYGVDTQNLDEKYIQMNAHDLLNLPMDRLRFRTEHEAGHVRISRMAETIPLEEWKQTGFSLLMNVIEDPRDNNFITEAYPKIREEMVAEYEGQWEKEREAKKLAKEKLGYQPKFMQAGYEYIKEWYREAQGGPPDRLSKDLPKDVKEVLKKTLKNARESWFHYPSKKEADQSEDLIREYAKISYGINKNEIWPEFKKLVEGDLKDQKLQEFLQETGKIGGDSHGGQGLPEDLEGRLAGSEKETLKSLVEGAKGKPVDLDSLSEGLKDKIKDYVESLPEEKRNSLLEKAKKSLSEFEKLINEGLEGKLVENPQSVKIEKGDSALKKEKKSPDDFPAYDPQKLKEFQDFAEKALAKDENVYEEYRRKVLPLIDRLESDLRDIFVARRNQHWKSGFASGRKIDIKRRIVEETKGISAVESRAWQKRELPKEKDYAITLLVDLSGSMGGTKIEETFKGVVALTEVLNRLSISTEILGFNNDLYEYQSFGEPMGKAVREKVGGMLENVQGSTDLGWATQIASERLDKQKAENKFLITLSDGAPEESSLHPRSEYELEKIIATIRQETNQKLIGLGLGPGTNHVEKYYPNSIANIKASELAGSMADVVREAIVNYNAF